MKLNFNPVTQNQIFSAYRINQSAAAKNGKAGAQAAEEGRRDLAMISPQGKQNSLVDTLMKQKMSIMEQKDSLISSTKKDGKSMDSIRSQLDAFEKQLKDIDQQIAEATTKEVQKQTEKGNKDNKPKTKQEVENARLANVMDLSQGLQRAEAVSSVKARVDGEARVLKSEIELDKMRGASEEAHADKENKLSDLQNKSAGLVSDIGEILADVTEKTAEQNEMAVMKDKDDTVAWKKGEEEEKTDSGDPELAKDAELKEQSK